MYGQNPSWATGKEDYERREGGEEDRTKKRQYKDMALKTGHTRRAIN